MSKRPPQSTHDAATAAGFDDREDSALAKESLEDFRLSDSEAIKHADVDWVAVIAR